MARPKKWTAADLNERVNAYFMRVQKTKEVACEQGLAKFLDITTLELQSWWDGNFGENGSDRIAKGEEEAVQLEIRKAYDNIMFEAQQLVVEKGTKAIGWVNFLLKQPRFGGYQDKITQKVDTTVKIVHSPTVEESDFQ